MLVLRFINRTPWLTTHKIPLGVHRVKQAAPVDYSWHHALDSVMIHDICAYDLETHRLSVFIVRARRKKGLCRTQPVYHNEPRLGYGLRFQTRRQTIKRDT